MFEEKMDENILELMKSIDSHTQTCKKNLIGVGRGWKHHCQMAEHHRQREDLKCDQSENDKSTFKTLQGAEANHWHVTGSGQSCRCTGQVGALVWARGLQHTVCCSCWEGGSIRKATEDKPPRTEANRRSQDARSMKSQASIMGGKLLQKGVRIQRGTVGSTHSPPIERTTKGDHQARLELQDCQGTVCSGCVSGAVHH